MRININKSIEKTYKNEIWKGFTLRELGCAAGALVTIGVVSFLAYRFFKLSFTVGVYIGIPFCFPWVLLGFKKFSGMTLLQYLKVRKARKEAGFLIKTDNLPKDIPARTARMQTDLSFGEEQGYLYEFDKKEWKRVRRADRIHRITHGKKVTFDRIEDDSREPKPAQVPIRKTKGNAQNESRENQPIATEGKLKKKKRSGILFAACAVLLFAAATVCIVKGFFGPDPQKATVQNEIHAETSKAEEQTKTKEPETERILSSDASLKKLLIGETAADLSGKTIKRTVGYRTRKIAISAEANEKNATIEGTGNYDLDIGKNRIKIVVKAEDGTTREYSVTVIRKKKKVSAKKPEETAEDTYGSYTPYPPDPGAQITEPAQPIAIIPENDGIQIIG